MKQEGVPDVDITKAVAELKARKKALEAKVSAECSYNGADESFISSGAKICFTLQSFGPDFACLQLNFVALQNHRLRFGTLVVVNIICS